MKFRNLKNNSWFPNTVTVCIGVILFVLLSNIGIIDEKVHNFLALFAPLNIGIIIAYVLNPLINLFEKVIFAKLDRRGRDLHVPATIISLLLVVFFLYTILHSLIPQLIDSIATFAGNIGTYTKEIQRFLEKLNSHKGMNIDVNKVTDSFKNLVNGIMDKLPNYASKAASMTASIGGTLLNWILGFILAIYFQLDKKRIMTTIKKFFNLILGDKKYKRFSDFLTRCNNIMVRYIACEIIEAIFIGAVNAVFMHVAHMPYIILISVVIGLTNMIPSFGPIIGGAIGAFILLLVTPKSALAFVIFTIILQIFDGYILKPKMYGNTLGVPSVLILTFIILGGKLFGIAGIILSIPFAAIVVILYTELVVPALIVWRVKKNADNKNPLIIEEVYEDDVALYSEEGSE